jgi:hypothetical protein
LLVRSASSAMPTFSPICSNVILRITRPGAR